jgi:hypothetical protein
MRWLMKVIELAISTIHVEKRASPTMIALIFHEPLLYCGLFWSNTGVISTYYIRRDIKSCEYRIKEKIRSRSGLSLRQYPIIDFA